MVLRNLTPHPIVIRAAQGQDLVIAPEHIDARNHETYARDGAIDTSGLSISFGTLVLGDASGLPPRESGTLLIVSSVTALSHPRRDDLVVPHPKIRDEDGQVVAASGLARVRAGAP